MSAVVKAERGAGAENIPICPAQEPDAVQISDIFMTIDFCSLLPVRGKRFVYLFQDTPAIITVNEENKNTIYVGWDTQPRTAGCYRTTNYRFPPKYRCILSILTTTTDICMERRRSAIFTDCVAKAEANDK